MRSPSKIVCVGWNYRPHITETDAVLPKEPIIFLKPSSCIVHDGDDIVIPKGVTNVQHEVEMALIVGKECHDVSEEDALGYVSHIAVFNDVTARDMQNVARDTGNPWSIAKGMDTFGPISDYISVEGVDLLSLGLTLTVNGEEQTISDLAIDGEGMTFSLADGTECSFSNPASYGGNMAPFSVGDTWLTMSPAA